MILSFMVFLTQADKTWRAKQQRFSSTGKFRNPFTRQETKYWLSQLTARFRLNWIFRLESAVYKFSRIFYAVLWESYHWNIRAARTYHEDLKKREDLRNSLVLLGVTPLWHVAQWVSRAPPHHTLPAFLNLNGSYEKITAAVLAGS